MLEESVGHSSSALSCKDYFHLGINLLVAVTDNPAFRLQTNHSFNETRNKERITKITYNRIYDQNDTYKPVTLSPGCLLLSPIC